MGLEILEMSRASVERGAAINQILRLARLNGQTDDFTANMKNRAGLNIFVLIGGRHLDDFQ